MAKEWTIVGQGAIGSLLSFQFSQYNIPFNVLLKEQQRCIDNRTLTDLAQQCHQYQINCIDLANFDPCSTVLVPVKAYDVIDALAALSTQLNQETHVILLNNGLGVIEQIKQRWPELSNIYVGTITHGALKTSSKHTQHTGQGQIILGSISSNPPSAEIIQLCQLLPNCSWQNDIKRSLWIKLAINACINPITAINGLQNKSVLSAEYTDTIRAVCEEISRVATFHQLDLKVDKLINTVREVSLATGENYSSMNKDVKQKRPTEIDYINGYVVKQALLHGINSPINQALWQQVKQQ